MKLEKLNDNQIRCILDRADLEEHELQLSELIHRSDKAKALFQDMMEQAAAELDFEVNNFPLMIEAVPISGDCLILVVTRVDDPSELEGRMPDISNITHMNIEINTDDLPFDADLDDLEDLLDGEDDLEDIDLFSDDDNDTIIEESDSDIEILPEEKDSDEKQEDSTSDSDDKKTEQAMDILSLFNESIARAKKEVLKKKKEEAEQKSGLQIYCFDKLESIIHLSGFLAPFFDGESHLYKDPVDSTYYFVLLQADGEKENFERACIITSDYGHFIDANRNSLAYFAEHFKAVQLNDAVQFLNQLN